MVVSPPLGELPGNFRTTPKRKGPIRGKFSLLKQFHLFRSLRGFATIVPKVTKWAGLDDGIKDYGHSSDREGTASRAVD